MKVHFVALAAFLLAGAFPQLVLRSSQMIQSIRLRAAQPAASSRSDVNHLFASEH
jgi:hypothetical protein